MGSKFSSYIRRSRRLSILAPIISTFACVLVIAFLSKYVHIVSVIGTTTAALVAAYFTYERAHHSVEKYVRFSIRARLAKKAEPDFDKLTRRFRPLGNLVQKSAHPSPEIKDALRIAEHQLGMRPGSVMPLVVPLELILGVPHNCPAAAAMLYANRHPVVLLDDHLQSLLDTDKDYEKNHNIVVSVFCHELAHLIGWNTRWTKFVHIGEIFLITASMASIAAYCLENNFAFGVLGAFITAANFAFEPGIEQTNKGPNVAGIISRIAKVSWIPFIVTGLIISAIPIGLVAGLATITFGFRYLLAVIRRKIEIYADCISAIALGTSSPLSDFFRTLSSGVHNPWVRAFSSHPPVNERIKALRRIKI